MIRRARRTTVTHASPVGYCPYGLVRTGDSNNYTVNYIVAIGLGDSREICRDLTRMTIGATANHASCTNVFLRGVRVDAPARRESRSLLRELLTLDGCQHVVTLNIEYLRRASNDPRLRSIVNKAAVVVPDGKPVAWFARLRGSSTSERITGHDLAQEAFAVSASHGASVFFLGAAPGVAQTAADNVKRSLPDVRIAGVYSPPVVSYPFPANENSRMVSAVNESGADIVLVAMGCPKQDYWIAENIHHIQARIAIGVGCVFDVLAGQSGRAPRRMQEAGLEWAYRLYREPRRLLTRYARDGAFVISLLAEQATSRRKNGRP